MRYENKNILKITFLEDTGWPVGIYVCNSCYYAKKHKYIPSSPNLNTNKS